jgi:hypothetical protein
MRKEKTTPAPSFHERQGGGPRKTRTRPAIFRPLLSSVHFLFYQMGMNPPVLARERDAVRYILTEFMRVYHDCAAVTTEIQSRVSQYEHHCFHTSPSRAAYYTHIQTTILDANDSGIFQSKWALLCLEEEVRRLLALWHHRQTHASFYPPFPALGEAYHSFGSCQSCHRRRACTLAAPCLHWMALCVTCVHAILPRQCPVCHMELECVMAECLR